MHAYMNQYSRIRGSGRIQCAYHRSSGETAASRMWKKYEISLQKSMEFLFQSHLKLTSAEKDYIISQVATSQWSGGHDSMPARQLNPQYPAPQQQFNSHIISLSRIKKKNLEHLSPDRMKKGMEETKASKAELSFFQ